MANDYINIYAILRPLSQASKINVKENLIKHNEKLKKLKVWNKKTIESLQNPDQVVKKNDKFNKTASKTFKCKAGRSVSFPVGKKQGRKKRECLKKMETMNLEENVSPKLRTRSVSRNTLQDYEVPSELEMLNMHTSLTSKCVNFLSSPKVTKMTSRGLKRKSCEELLETSGVKSKRLARHSLSSNIFVHSDSFEQSAEKRVCGKTSYIVNETPISCLRSEILLNVGGVKAKTFLERLSLNCNETSKSKELNSTSVGSQEARFNSYLASAEPVPRLEATFNISCQKSDQTANDSNMSDKNMHLGKQENGTSGSSYPKQNLIQGTTPLRRNASKSSNETNSKPQRLSPSTSDTRIIKKKNLTSYLNSKTTEHPKVISEPEKPVQEVVGMQLRKLRSRPPILNEIKPAKKRTRMQKNTEEFESKLKCKEESIKQKKLDLQIKAEERKQRREERMRKTKETREKLEKERLEKVQNSGGRKRQRVDSNKETEVKKRRTRQAAKQSTDKKVITKVTKKKRSTSAPVTRTQKLKRSLVTVNETETDGDTSCGSKKDSPKKVKPKNTKQAAKSKAANFTFTQKNPPADKAISNKPQVPKNISPKAILTDNTQTSATFVCSTTFIAQTSPVAPKEVSITANKENPTAEDKETPITASKETPVAIKKGMHVANKENPNATFKQLPVTPSPALNKSLRSIPEYSERQSSTANYDMTPYHDEDEDSNDEDDLRKPIPNWASGIRLKAAIIKQAHDPPNTDKLFGALKRNVNLTDIFGRNHRKYRKRTSSAVWQNISFNLEDSLIHNKSSIVLT